jgi:linoleoyl-CoA desaturase
MQKLKFEKDEGNAFYRELKEKINRYFDENKLERTGNRQMRFKIGLYFGLTALFYVLMLFSANMFVFFTTYLLMGLAVLLTAFNVSHDAAHGVAVKSKRWNKILFESSFQLQGNNAYVWGKNHNESHHLYTNVEGSDIDVLNNPLVRMTDTQPLRWFHRYQHLYTPMLYLLYSLNWFLFRETLMAFNYSSRTIEVRMPRTEVYKLVFFKLFYLFYMIAVPYWVLPFGLGVVLWAFLFNHFMVSILFTAVLGVSHLSDFVHHPVPDAHGQLNISWPKLQLLTSVDYNAGSVFLNWTLGGFNAHALHHLLPDVCHVHYLKILPIFRETCAKYGFVYMEMPYGAALRAHFRFLKKMGQRPVNQPISFSANNVQFNRSL